MHAVMRAVQCATLSAIHLDCDGTSAPEILNKME